MTVLGRHIETVQPAAAPASRPGERREGCQGKGKGEGGGSQKFQTISYCDFRGVSHIKGLPSEILWHPWKEIDGLMDIIIMKKNSQS